jgi:hypothetical protein
MGDLPGEDRTEYEHRFSAINDPLYGQERNPVISDSVLLIIVALLLATVVGYLTDLLPYPFGIIVLSILLVARVLSLKMSK